MTKQASIERTIKAMGQLSEEKAQEVADFADFVSQRYEETQMRHGLQTLAADSQAFDFLLDEEELYSIADLKKTVDE